MAAAGQPAAAPAAAPAAVPADKLCSPQTIEAVRCLKVVLEKGLQPGAGRTDSGLLDSLTALRSLGPVPLRAVSETGIGKVVAGLSKDEGLSGTVRATCKEFILQWKDQLTQSKAARLEATPGAPAAAAATPSAGPAAAAAPPVPPAPAAAAAASAAATTGARWTPPPVKAAPLPPSVPAVKSAGAVGGAAAAQPLPTPAAVLRAAAADAAPPKAEDFEEPAPPAKEDSVAQEVAATAARVRTEYECGEPVFTCMLEVRSQMRRVLAPFRKTRKRAEADERLVKALAARLPDSDALASQWRSGAIVDQDVPKLLKDLPQGHAPQSARSVGKGSSGSSPPKAKKGRKAAKDEGEDEGEEDEDEDQSEPAGRGRGKAKAKLPAKMLVKKLFKRPAAAMLGKHALALKKKRLGG